MPQRGAQRWPPGLGVRQSSLFFPHTFRGSFRQHQRCEPYQPGPTAQVSMFPRRRGLKARPMRPGAPRMNRAFGPLPLLHQQPGPLAQAGMSTGLWP